MQRPLLIGTRGSRLALAQAHLLRMALASANGWTRDELETTTKVVIIKTSGETISSQSTARAKGLFTKELEESLLRGEIDVAIHSVKDLLAIMPNGLTLAATLPREDPRDVFVARAGGTLSDLALGARLGTSAPRRRAQVLRLRPDLEIVGLRGNVETRLRKLESGECDATFLAHAGLKRLGLLDLDCEIMNPSVMLPPAGQGAIGLQVREDARVTIELLRTVNHQETETEIVCERAFLAEVEGSCRTPLAALCTLSDEGLGMLRGEVLLPDGKDHVTVERQADLEAGDLEGAAELGRATARALRDRAGHVYFSPSP